MGQMLLLWAAVIALGWRVGALTLALYRNWTLAKNLQVPLIICPIAQHGMFGKLIRAVIDDENLACISKYLPFVRFCREGWAYREKHKVCADYGDVFALVTISGVQLFIADMDAAKSVLTRTKDFPKPIEIMSRTSIPSLAIIC